MSSEQVQPATPHNLRFIARICFSDFRPNFVRVCVLWKSLEIVAKIIVSILHRSGLLW
jgi:hypothetical protein